MLAGRQRLHNIWNCMIRRCHKPAPSDYENGIEAYYHGRGIQVCEEWRTDFNSFYRWALNTGYDDNLTIDRIDPDGDYQPGNCRWVTRSENCSRARKLGKNSNIAHHKRSGRYFTVLYLCGANWGIVDQVHITYHETLLRGSEVKLSPGRVLRKMKHTKETAHIKPGDIVDM